MSKEWSKTVMAANIRRYLSATGETQKELASIVGVSPPTINDWCNAKKYPGIEKIEKMAEHWRIAKSDLIEDKLTSEKEADNDTMANIVVRMRTDRDFMELVAMEYQLDNAMTKKVTSIVSTFIKQFDD